MLFFCIGALVGILLGLTGAGGSVFAVPMLLLLTPLPATQVMGLSLGAVAVSAAYGSFNQWRKKSLLTAPTVILALGGFVTAPLGRWLSTLLSEPILLSVFTTMAIVIAFWMWISAIKRPADTEIIRSGYTIEAPQGNVPCRFNPNGQFQLQPRCIGSLLIVSGIVGLTSGLLGVGGGFMIVPALLLISQASMAQAVGSSLFIITVISSAGFISQLVIAPLPQWQPLIWIICGSLIGMLISQFLGQKIKGPALQKFFAIALVFISLITLIRRIL